MFWFVFLDFGLGCFSLRALLLFFVFLFDLFLLTLFFLFDPGYFVDFRWFDVIWLLWRT